MAGLIATKVGMSRVFTESGDAVAVTYLKVEPNTVVRCKTEEKDGYNAVVLGVKPKTLKTRKGKEHTKYRIQKEWKVDSVDPFSPGAEITSSIVPEDANVTVTGVSKGKGFQGVIKRHKFSRGPETHGSHHHRRPGSVGMCEFPGRILKGKKMPGHMGGDQVTIRSRSVLVSDTEEGILGVKGAVPGPNGGTVFLTFEFEPEFDAAPAAEQAPEVAPEAEEAPVEEAAETEAPAATEEASEAPSEPEAAEEKPAEEASEAEAEAPADDNEADAETDTDSDSDKDA